MRKTGLITALILLTAFGIYQFRVYRVAAMEANEKWEHEHTVIVRVPTPGMKTSEYESGCLAALTRVGTINAENRQKIDELSRP